MNGVKKPFDVGPVWAPSGRKFSLLTSVRFWPNVFYHSLSLTARHWLLIVSPTIRNMIETPSISIFVPSIPDGYYAISFHSIASYLFVVWSGAVYSGRSFFYRRTAGSCPNQTLERFNSLYVLACRTQTACTLWAWLFRIEINISYVFKPKTLLFIQYVKIQLHIINYDTKTITINFLCIKYRQKRRPTTI